jgi:uncharacterized protein YbjT (DUF2867 family)
MAEQKIIAVVGATGAQGGGLVRAIQADRGGGFRARAITRDANSPKAAEFAALGAEVVSADIDDEESLVRAFDGAHGAFCVTFYWAHFSPEKEIAEAGNMARAAKRAGVRHAVWSTLEDTRRWIPLEDERMPTLMGKYKVPHFDGKGEADHLFADAGVPATRLLTSFFWENFIYFGMGPKRGSDGRLAITLPMGDRKLPGIAAEDIGKCAYGVFRNGGMYMKRTVGIAGDHPTGAEMALSLTRALGQEVDYHSVPFSVYREFGFPGADDLGNMFQFKHDFNSYFCNVRNLDFSRGLNPDLQSFETWAQRNKDRIPLD